MVDVDQEERADGGKAGDLEVHHEKRNLKPKKFARAEPGLKRWRGLVIGPEPEPPPRTGPFLMDGSERLLMDRRERPLLDGSSRLLVAGRLHRLRRLWRLGRRLWKDLRWRLANSSRRGETNGGTTDGKTRIR